VQKRFCTIGRRELPEFFQVIFLLIMGLRSEPKLSTGHEAWREKLQAGLGRDIKEDGGNTSFSECARTE
jgi:hypothetical protein